MASYELDEDEDVDNLLAHIPAEILTGSDSLQKQGDGSPSDINDDKLGLDDESDEPREEQVGDENQFFLTEEGKQIQQLMQGGSGSKQSRKKTSSTTNVEKSVRQSGGGGVSNVLQESCFNVEQGGEGYERQTNTTIGKASFTEKNSGLAVTDAVLDVNDLERLMRGKTFVPLHLLRPTSAAADVPTMRGTRGDYKDDKSNEVTFAVLVSRKTKQTTNGGNFGIWQVTDLRSEQTTTVFVFGACYEAHWRISDGSVVGLLDPSVQLDRRGNDAASEKSRIFANAAPVTLKISHPLSLLVLGRSRDLLVCKGQFKDGRACTRIVNKAKSSRCLLHAVQHAKSYFNKRPALQASGATLALKPSSADSRKRRFIDEMTPPSAPRAAAGDGSLSVDSKVAQRALGMLDAGHRPNNNPSASIGPKGTGRIPTLDNVISRQDGLIGSLVAAGSRQLSGAAKMSSEMQRRRQAASAATKDVSAGAKDGKTGASRSPQKLTKSSITTFAGLSQRYSASASCASSIDGGLPREKPANSSTDWAKGKLAELAKVERVKSIVRQKGIRLEMPDPNDPFSPKQPKLRRQEVSRDAKRDHVIPQPPGSTGTGSATTSGVTAAATSVDSGRKAELEKYRKLFGEDVMKERTEEAYSQKVIKPQLEGLVQRDEIETQLSEAVKMKVTAYRCTECARTMSTSASASVCRERGHAVRPVEATRRFFACASCGRRTSTLERYPAAGCERCGGRKFDKAGVRRPAAARKTPGDADKFLARGVEEKFINSL